MEILPMAAHFLIKSDNQSVCGNNTIYRVLWLFLANEFDEMARNSDRERCLR